MTTQDFSWVDTYFDRVKPYLYIRMEDLLLIKRPNEVQKLNESGAFILKHLLDGHSIYKILNGLKADEEKTLQVFNFLTAIRESVEGHLSIYSCNPAVSKRSFETGIIKLPVLSEIALTYRCNLKCGFCYAGCNLTHNPVNSNKELSTDEVKLIIHKIFHQAKVPSVSFTGGEPMLRKDIPELIKYAKTLGMRVNLISNGTLIGKEVAKSLKDAGLDSAQISIEGVCAATHDLLTGNKGSFEKSVHAINLLKDLDIHTHTNTTLNRENLQEATLFPSFVKSTLKLNRFSMNMMIPSGSVNKNEQLKLFYSEMGPIINSISEAAKKEDVTFMWYSPLPMCMFNTITHGLGNKGCAACDGLLSVAANGDLLPCSSYDSPVGNLIEDDFDTIWKGTKATYFNQKQFAPEVCKTCEHFTLCQGACPLYWRDMGEKELENVQNTKMNLKK